MNGPLALSTNDDLLSQYIPNLINDEFAYC